MDRFAGSEPRLFISFHLDKESIGQPAPVSIEAVDSTLFDLGNPAQTFIPSDDSIEVIEVLLSRPERSESAPDTPSKGPIKPEPEESTFLLLSEMYRRGGFSISSSDSNERVAAFFTRKHYEALHTFKQEVLTTDGPLNKVRGKKLRGFPNTSSQFLHRRTCKIRQLTGPKEHLLVFHNLSSERLTVATCTKCPKSRLVKIWGRLSFLLQ